MAKQPVESHRFRIHCEAEEEKLGRILAQLTILGVANVGYELVTDVKTFGIRPKRDPSEPSHEAFTAEWIKKNKTFRVRDLARHFKDNGRNPSTAHGVVRTMTGKGLLRLLAEGHYQSTEVKHIEGPKKPKPAGKPEQAKAAPEAAAATAPAAKRTRRGGSVPRFDVSNRELIEKSIRSKHRFTAAAIKQLFVDAKRNPHSASPILWHLAKEKIIKIVEPGVYEVLAKKQKAPIAKNHAQFLEQERLRAKARRDANKRQRLEAAAPANIETITTTEEVANG